MSKIFKTEFVKAIGGFGPAQFAKDPDVTEHKYKYVRKTMEPKAALCGARAYIRAILTGKYYEASDLAFDGCHTAINRYARDPRYGVFVRVRCTITNRHAKYGEVFGKTEYLDPIPKGYVEPYMGGRDWLLPALRSLTLSSAERKGLVVARGELKQLIKTCGPYGHKDEYAWNVKQLNALLSA